MLLSCCHIYPKRSDRNYPTRGNICYGYGEASVERKNLRSVCVRTFGRAYPFDTDALPGARLNVLPHDGDDRSNSKTLVTIDAHWCPTASPAAFWARNGK